jgi:AcrR family transcriptional regulator
MPVKRGPTAPPPPSPPAPTTPPRPRGRPRSTAARDAVLRAAREILDEVGPAGLTIEAVAARAGVGKPTIYRTWPDRHAVAMAALMAHGPESTSGRTAGAAPLAALRRQLEDMAGTFASRTGRNVASMIATSHGETELSKAFRNHFVLARRDEGRALLVEARRRGDLRSGIDVDVALDLIYGPLFFRLLVGHAPLDRAFVRRTLETALEGLRAR